MRVRALLLSLLLLAGCVPTFGASDAPVAARLDHEGPPTRWNHGDRIRVEGRIRAGGEIYLIDNIMGAGPRTTKNCVILRGLETAYWRPLRWKMAVLADSDAMVAIVGRSVEEQNLRRDNWTRCGFEMEIESIELL